MAGEKRSVWEVFLKDSVSRSLSALSGMSDKVSQKFSGMQSRISSISGSFKEWASEIPGVGTALEFLSNPITLVVAGVTALATGLFKAEQYAENFQTGMAKINATAQLSQPELDKLRTKLVDMGANSAADLATVPDAYEKILSQTGDVNLSLDIMQTALNGAQAGFTEVDTVAGALAQTLSIVGAENTNAKEVMDTLFAAKRVGAGEFKDFAQYMPGLIAAGKNMSLQYKDVAGVFAYMTGKGQSAADSAMLMQNAFSALQKGEITRGMEAAGVKVFNKDGSRRDIALIFEDLEHKMAKFSDKGKSNFLENIGLKDVQARNAFSIMTSDVGKLNEALAATRNAVGETNKAMEMTKNPATENAIMMNKFKAIFLDIGYTIMPYVHSFFNKIGNGILSIINKVKEWYNNSELMQDIVWAIGKIFESIGWVIGKIGDALSWVGDNILGPIFTKIEHIYRALKALFTGDWDTAGKYTLDVLGIKEYNGPEKAAAKEDDAAAKTESIFGDDPGKKGTLDPGTNDKLQNGISNISDGGKQQHNVYVHIDKLVEALSVHTTTLKEGSGEIKRIVEEALLRAVNGSELALANS